MGGAGDDGWAEYGAHVVWAAKPTARAVVGEFLVSLVIAALYVGAIVLFPPADPWPAWAGLIPPMISAVRSLVTGVRGRVVLRPQGIEVRRILTRRYPWSDLLSVTLDEDGRIEMTPKGWVRHLPIPKDETAAAFGLIMEWRAAAFLSAI